MKKNLWIQGLQKCIFVNQNLNEIRKFYEQNHTHVNGTKKPFSRAQEEKSICALTAIFF